MPWTYINDGVKDTISKAKDFTLEAKAKDLTSEAKAKDLTVMVKDSIEDRNRSKV
jgi:hypothetical protein